jgi:hypothetical protein
MFEDDDLTRKNYRESDIFKKAEEICELVERIVSVDVDDGSASKEHEKAWFKSSQEYLRNNSHIICAKIAGAYGDTLYDIKMENAAIIRKAARELITDSRGLQINGYKEIEYLDLLRVQVEEFRILFAEWVKTFDMGDYLIDRWGLFNPPGVNYDDHDPDDDIPFDRENFLKEMGWSSDNEDDDLDIENNEEGEQENPD